MTDDRGQNRRRRPRRVGDMLGDLARQMGIQDELLLARRMAAWERLVEELLPATHGSSRLLSVQPPVLIVSAADNLVAQELLLRQSQLLDAFGQLPDGMHMLELRVVVRSAGRSVDPR